jgi:hypothetical protein
LRITTSTTQQSNGRPRYVTGSLHWWQGRADGFAERLVSHARLILSLLATPPSTRRTTDTSRRRLSESLINRLVCVTRGSGDVDDDKRSPDAAAMLFAKGSWFAALRSVVVNELLVFPSFPCPFSSHVRLLRVLSTFKSSSDEAADDDERPTRKPVRDWLRQEHATIKRRGGQRCLASCEVVQRRSGTREHGHTGTRARGNTETREHGQQEHGHTDHRPGKHGNTGTRKHGNTGTRARGNTGTRTTDQGNTGTRAHGNTETREHEHAGTWKHGNTGTRKHGHTGTLAHGNMDHGHTDRGNTSTRAHGPRKHGSTGTLKHGNTGTRAHGITDHGTTGTRKHGNTDLGGSTYARTSGVQRRLESSFVEATPTTSKSSIVPGVPK